MHRLFCSFAFVTFAMGMAFAQDTKPMPPSESSAFTICEWGVTKVKALPSGTAQRTLIYRFKNRTLDEVMSVAMQYGLKLNGRRVFLSDPTVITSFPSAIYPHTGSILPFTKTLAQEITFLIPAKYNQPGYSPFLTFKDVKVWNHKGSLSDAGHLFTKIAITHTPDLKAIFDKDPSLLKVTNAQHFTPILMAFAAADLDFIHYLEGKGLRSTATSTRGHNALFMAAMTGDPRNMDYALKVGCKVNALLPNSKRTAVHKAVLMGSVMGLQWLLAHGANPSLPDVDHMTPLRIAVLEGQRQAINMLVQAKADIHFHGPDGRGILHDCVVNPLMFSTVGQLGLSVNDADKKTGMTPLMLAAKSHDPNAIVWLIQHGAKLELKDRAGRTASDYAKSTDWHGTDNTFLTWVATAKRGGIR